MKITKAKKKKVLEVVNENKTSLILVRKRSKKECLSACDKLGLNAFEFTRKIHQPHNISFICGLCANPNL